MALNKFMHPRNVYKKKKPDFKQLAMKYPNLQKHMFTDLTGKAFIDFKNASSMRELSIALLKDDFGLDVTLPPEGLVPTVSLRLNYIHWIEDILEPLGRGTNIKGIDIGTGASCVYPLLGCKLNPSWSFLAVEKCDTNTQYAEKNVSANKMEDRIKVRKQQDDSILLHLLHDTDTVYDFCMCNPPFFADHSEAQGTSRKDDRAEPSSVSMATPSESITEGGEIGFVKNMIQESMELKSKVRVYTSMVGKKSSLPKLKEEIRRLEIPNFTTTEFCQGKTMRWGIAWSFDSSVIFPKSLFQAARKEKDRPPLQYTLPSEFVGDLDLQTIAKQIYFILKEELKISCDSSSESEDCLMFEMTAKENTWSHQRRKRRAKKMVDTETRKESPTNDPPERSNSDIDFEKTSHYKDKIRGNPTTDLGKKKTSEVKSMKRKYQTFDRENSQEEDSKRRRFCPDIEKLRQSPDRNAEEENIEMLEGDTISVGQSDVQDCSMGGKDKETEGCTATEQSQKTSYSDSVDKKEKEYILKFKLTVKKLEQFAIEMAWIDGQNREFMHQVLQYLKNKVKSNNNKQSSEQK
ncbi:hypothetical protein FSP39_019944 [Pinctada imbricata]|uniref:U6 small nuclear RNA (adenine-(43)-N(6))-methyltransferase n=1 Tax=Pinctada imbricata TaxID=66713 RepID=A0AA88XGE3_PINIB|nr:hypothetical protein FSP39_019944 [Pinctada imbricata]